MFVIKKARQSETLIVLKLHGSRFVLENTGFENNLQKCMQLF